VLVVVLHRTHALEHELDEGPQAPIVRRRQDQAAAGFEQSAGVAQEPMRDRGMQVLDHFDGGDDVEGPIRSGDDARHGGQRLERDAPPGELRGDLAVREVNLA
jgi:hypothetical protein